MPFPIHPSAAPLASRHDHRANEHEERLQRLITRLPPRLRNAIRWLRRPSARWLRVPVGVLLIIGSLLSILPVFGLWMLPLGLMLLSEDVPPLRRAVDRLLARLERRWPHWFAGRGPDTRS